MSWLRRAYTISTPDPDAYYVAVDPGEFYEWKYTGVIPKGTGLTKYLPRSDIFTNGLVVASVVIPKTSLKSKPNGVELLSDIQAEVNLEIGQIQSPQELLEKHSELVGKFDTTVKQFVQATETRSYFVSGGDKPNLYKVTSHDDSTAQLQSYGPLKEILVKLNEARTALNNKSLIKGERAYEMEKSRRFENAMTIIENDNYPVDKTVIETLISIAELKPDHTKSSAWIDCCVELSSEARDMKKLLDRYHSLSWIRDSLRIS